MSNQSDQSDYKYLKNLSKNLNKLREDGNLTDLIIKTEGVRGASSFFAHRSVLHASSSKYFKTKLYKDNVTEIPIRFDIVNLHEQHIKQVLSYLYTGDIKLNLNDAKIIYQICCKLDIDDLKNQSAERMVSGLNIDNCYEFWRFGKEKGLERLEKESLYVIGKNLKIFFDNNIHILEAKEVDEIFARLELDWIHDDRYAVLSNWFKQNSDKSDVRFCINDLLKRHIDFKKITDSCLFEIRKDNFMKQNTNISNLIVDLI